MEENNQQNNIIWYTAGILVVVVAGYWLFFRAPKQAGLPMSSDLASTTNQIGALGQATIEINNQFDTSTVIVDRALTSQPAWIAIHEDRAGQPGNILGAAWVPAGENLNVQVQLQRAATEGQTYYAIIHTDDGDGGARFDFKTDLPLTDDNGAPVMKTFQIIFDKG